MSKVELKTQHATVAQIFVSKAEHETYGFIKKLPNQFQGMIIQFEFAIACGQQTVGKSWVDACKTDAAALESLGVPVRSTRHLFKPSNSTIQVLFLDDVAMMEQGGEGQSSRHTRDHKSVVSHCANTNFRRAPLRRSKGPKWEFKHKLHALAPKSNFPKTKLQGCPISHDVSFQNWCEHCLVTAGVAMT